MVPKTGLEPVRYRYRRILSPVRLPVPPLRHKWRHRPDSNWSIRVLQTLALPLGYGAIRVIICTRAGCVIKKMERKTSFELATFALARRRSTTEPLPHIILFAIHNTQRIKLYYDIGNYSGGSYRARTCDLLLVRQMLSQLS